MAGDTTFGPVGAGVAGKGLARHPMAAGFEFYRPESAGSGRSPAPLPVRTAPAPLPARTAEEKSTPGFSGVRFASRLRSATVATVARDM